MENVKKKIFNVKEFFSVFFTCEKKVEKNVKKSLDGALFFAMENFSKFGLLHRRKNYFQDLLV